MAPQTQTTLTFRALDGADPAVAQLIRREYDRQSRTLDLGLRFPLPYGFA